MCRRGVEKDVRGQSRVAGQSLKRIKRAKKTVIGNWLHVEKWNK